MKFRQAREIAEDIAVEIIEAVEPERVKDIIYDQVYGEHGDNELVQKMVFEQFQRLVKRLKDHVRGPVSMRPFRKSSTH